MSDYARIYKLTLFGAPVHVHWSIIVVAISVMIIARHTPITAVIVVLSYMGMMLLHEVGHACIAFCLDCPPCNIYLTLFHTWSEYPTPRSAYQTSLIAWGGSLAQIIIAQLLIWIMRNTLCSDIPLIGPLLLLMAYISCALAAIHLLPIANLDGKDAWRLFGLLAQDAQRKLTQWFTAGKQLFANKQPFPNR